MKQKSSLHPATDSKVYKRRLPHIEIPGTIYFITFNVRDGLILSDAVKDIVLRSIKFHADKKYTLYACVVMDTHVHIILQPLEQSEGLYYKLPQIVHSIKSYSANRLQKVLNVQGNV